MFARIALLVGVFTSPLCFAQMTPDWAEGEHLELGDSGASLACQDLGFEKARCPIRGIARKDGKILFSYGEIVASADFYNTPMDFYLDAHTGIKKVLRCAHEMMDDHPVHRPDEPAYNECTFTGIIFMHGVLEVISQNYNHFGWNNMKAYVYYHQQALNKAREAFLKKGTPEGQTAWFLALALNGYADHYLTDAFAAGHIRLPRIQIKKWAKENLQGTFKATRGDALSIILHNNESRNLKTGYEQGFQVQNSRGETWLTHGDEFLHVDTNKNDPGFVMPLTAVRESFKELLSTWQTGKIPMGTFRATTYVPFSNDVSLIEKLSSRYQQMSRTEMIIALYSVLPLYQNLIFPKQDFEMMLDHLPEIFFRFQQDILEDLGKNPELDQRLPRRYLEAYFRVT